METDLPLLQRDQTRVRSTLIQILSEMVGSPKVEKKRKRKNKHNKQIGAHYALIVTFSGAFSHVSWPSSAAHNESIMDGMVDEILFVMQIAYFLSQSH